MLNIADGFITYIGVGLGLIGEANPVMQILYNKSPMYFLGTKLSLSLLLYLFLYFGKIPNYQIVTYITLFGASFYTIIMCFHGIWIVDGLFVSKYGG